jgi:hypothetical protein
MTDLTVLEAYLNGVEIEATRYGMSKSLRDRLSAARDVLPAIEAERERRSKR